MDLLILVVVFVIITILIMLFGRDPIHDWQYRNPYDRTCKICGRNEQEECWGDDYESHGLNAPGSWEVYRNGNGACDKKS